MADFLPRRWRRQPQGAVTLDTSHPLLRGAVFVGAVLNGTAWEYVRNRRLGFNGASAASVSATSNERAAILEQSTSDSVFLASSAELNVTGDVTLLYRFLFTSASANGAHFGKTTGNGTTATPFGVDFSSGQTRFIRSNSGFRYFDFSAVPFNRTNTCLLATSEDITTQPVVYNNGVFLSLITQVGTGTGVSTGNANQMRMGARNDNAVRQTGFANLGIVWARRLTEGEAFEMTYAPWQVFRPHRARVYSLPSAAVFRPAWAAGSNQYIGGGLHA
jgi:hypothetical protein